MGFVTGMLVGAALSSGSPSPVSHNELVASDKHDVIVCKRYSYKENLCEGPFDKNTGDRYTIEGYAAFYGYKVVHKIGFLPNGSAGFIVMEVSK